jgi:hypothetical protein
MKHLIKSFIIIGFLVGAKFSFSANTLSTGDYELEANATGTLTVSITNDVSFSAFQFDLVIPEHFTLDETSVMLAGRENEHDFSWEMLEGNVLRAIAYSETEESFTGSSGAVVQFDLAAGTKPGTYPLTLQNVIVAGGGTDILDQVNSGNIILRTPEVTLTPASIDFGDVPLLQQASRSITIQNTGNSLLTISSLTVSHPDYSLNDETGFTLNAGSSVSRTLYFYATEKGLKEGDVTVTSDCPAHPTSAVTFSTNAFAVNEIHLGTATGRSGYTVTLPISINNMEPFTGFQAEIQLPEEIQFVPGSEVLSGRATDHQITADTTKNKLIIAAWSDSNDNFADEDGQIASVDLYLEGNGGNYPLNFNDAIIADTVAANILSASYNSTVRIKSPSLHLSTTNYNFGEVAVTDSAEYTFTINNYGDDTLKVSSISSTESSFQVSNENYPIVVPPSGNKNVSLKFKNENEEIYSGKINIRNNDVNHDPATINVNGETFEPNELVVIDTSGKVGSLNYLEVEMDNYTAISAFQFDLALPDGFSVVEDSCYLSNRSEDHGLSISNISANAVRFVSYSGSLKTYSGNAGTVVSIALLTDQETPLGVYDMDIQNVILSDITSANVVSQVTDGQFELLTNTVYDTISAQICEGESYILGEQTLTTSGEYTEIFQGIEGNDSIVTLNLTVESCSIPTNEQVSSKTVSDGTTDCFNATNTITVADEGDVIVESGASANFIAGHSILFRPGFHAQAGSYVDAHITTTGSFCDDLPAAPIMAAEPIADKSVEFEEPELEDDTFERQSLVVYPNPNNGSFTIKLENIESETRVLMYNSIGQKVYDITMTEQLHSVELPNVQRGIYFIKAINNQKQFDQKIVVQ